MCKKKKKEEAIDGVITHSTVIILISVDSYQCSGVLYDFAACSQVRN